MFDVDDLESESVYSTGMRNKDDDRRSLLSQKENLKAQFKVKSRPSSGKSLPKALRKDSDKMSTFYHEEQKKQNYGTVESEPTEQQTSIQNGQIPLYEQLDEADNEQKDNLHTPINNKQFLVNESDYRTESPKERTGGRVVNGTQIPPLDLENARF